MSIRNPFSPGPRECLMLQEELRGGDHTGAEPGLVCMISQSMTGSEPGRWPLCHCHRICSLSSLLSCSTFCVLMMMVSAPPLAPGPGVSNDGVWRLSPCVTPSSADLGPAPDTAPPTLTLTLTPASGVTRGPDWSLHYVYTGLVTPLKMLSCS